MNIAVFRNHRRIPSRIEHLVGRRVGLALGRLIGRVTRVEVRLSRSAGDRNGQTRRCRIHVELRPRGIVIAEATESNFVSAINRAAGRAVRRIRKRVTRRRQLNRYVLRRTAA